jgi:hypothetical protein
MQLDTGKSRHGLVGTLRAIIKEEGYVRIESHDHQSANLIPLYIGLAVCIEVRVSYFMDRVVSILTLISIGLVPPLLLEAPKRAVKLRVAFFDIIQDERPHSSQRCQ